MMMGSFDSETPDPVGDVLAARDAALVQIGFVRRYVLEMLDATPQELWFEIPDGFPSCVAWQVGHLAVSQYGLLMFRQRGRQPEDLELIPGRFRKAYGRGSNPSGDAAKQPSAGELLTRLTEVYEAAIPIAANRTAEQLGQECEMPYAGYADCLGAILFCPLHEQLHAGQIGVLRRGLGLEPIR
ncbi:MAG: DinB family protein [Planctomycetota bacterium]